MAKAKKPENMGEKEWNTHRLYFLAAELIIKYGFENQIHSFYVNYTVSVQDSSLITCTAEWRIFLAIKCPKTTKMGDLFSGYAPNAAAALKMFKNRLVSYKDASTN